MIRKKFVGIICLFSVIMITLLPVFEVSGINTYNYRNNITLNNNTPPNPPEISGVTYGTTGEIYNYSIVAIDPDGDDVSYYIEFGTGDFIITNDWYPSGEPINISYIWRETGKFTIRAKAQDIYYATSDWGTLEVKITGDDIAPEIKIEKPENALYIMGYGIRKFLFNRKPLIIGKINITVDVSDSISGLDKVEFYIDDVLKASDDTPPYNFIWMRDKITIFKHRHTIKAIAYDKEGNSAKDEITIWRLL